MQINLNPPIYGMPSSLVAQGVRLLQVDATKNGIVKKER